MRKSKTFQRLLVYVLKYKMQILFVFVLALFSSGSTLAATFFAGRGIDHIVGQGNVDLEGLAPILAVLLVLYLLASFSNWGVTTLSIYISNKTVADMRRDGFDKITKLPLKFFDSSKSGDLMSRFSNDIEAISEGILQLVTQFFTGIVTLVGAMVLMLLIDIWIAVAVFIVAPMAILIAGFIARRSGRQFKTQQAVIGEYNSHIEESIGNFKVVKAFGYEKRTEETAAEINARLYVCGQKAQFYSSLVNPSTRFVNNIAYVFVGLIGGLSGAAGGLSVGVVSSLLTYSAQFAKPLNEMTGVISQLQASFAAAERFFSLMDEESEEAEESKPEISNLKGGIVFDNVAFSYSKEMPLIENFDIHITEGSMVAVVGPTGAGKTTLVNLLMRFYDLDAGHIYIDGKDIRDMKRDSVRLAFGMVLQETWLFSGTIRENIAYGLENAADEEIISAAKASRAHGFIKRLEKGYDTVISEDGGSLSQGEKQLLTIARAMLANSPMMILDEATSSVDPRTEIKIQDAMQKLMINKTSFVIAHRLATIEQADIILVMNQGKIIETGTHIKLLEANGFYAGLYNSQFANAGTL